MSCDGVTLVLDGMGGDRGAAVTARAAIEVAHETGVRILLTGFRSHLEPQLELVAASSHASGLVEIVECQTDVGMDESPAVAFKEKRLDSGLGIGFELVKSGRAHGIVTAGNSGAAMAFALGILGRMANVRRPPILLPIPTRRGVKVLLDAGANVDCKPLHLVQFAVMGSVYAQTILGIPNPRIGLMSNGTEVGKGNALTRATDEALREMVVNVPGLDYVGNIEGREMMSGGVDVTVCDGFVGNVILKSSEALTRAIGEQLRAAIEKNWLWRVGMLLARNGIRQAFDIYNPNNYGGALLLGVRGVTVIAHGASKVKALKNALLSARDFVEKGLLGRFASAIEQAPH